MHIRIKDGVGIVEPKGKSLGPRSERSEQRSHLRQRRFSHARHRSKTLESPVRIEAIVFLAFFQHPYERGEPMYRDLLSSRWFQGGGVFFLLCVCGSLLYSWHVQRSTETALEPHDRWLQAKKRQKNTPLAAREEKVTKETVASAVGEMPDENTDRHIA